MTEKGKPRVRGVGLVGAEGGKSAAGGGKGKRLEKAPATQLKKWGGGDSVNLGGGELGEGTWGGDLAWWFSGRWM